MTEKLLMCTPEGFAVNYVINPWMHDQIGTYHPIQQRASGNNCSINCPQSLISV